jgi:hypothetical protein
MNMKWVTHFSLNLREVALRVPSQRDSHAHTQGAFPKILASQRRTLVLALWYGGPPIPPIL